MDKKKSRDVQDLWVISGQIIVLAVGFFAVFSWNADIEPKILLMIILTIVILQYPMHDRLRSVLGDEVMEVRKALYVAQIMLMDIRRSLDIDDEARGEADHKLIQQAEHMADQMQSIQNTFDDAFEGARKSSGEFRIDYLLNTVGVIVYQGIIIGIAALLGWLTSLAVNYTFA